MQLYTLLAEVDGIAYPAAYMILPNKRSATYRAAFQNLRSSLGEISLKRFLIDFESSAIKEFSSAFKECKKVAGCLVHFKRNLWKRLGTECHLQGLYNKHEQFNLFVNCLAALTFVHPDELASYYKLLLEVELPEVCKALESELDPDECDRVKERMNSFLDYLEKTYIGSHSRTGWTRPRFPPELWSKYEDVLGDEQLTTNRNEAYHSALRKSVPLNSSLWTLIDTLIDSEAKARVRREEFCSHSPSSSETGREKRRSGRSQELKSVVQNKDNWSRLDYLKRIAGLSRLS
jgi:hypothetical protein